MRVDNTALAAWAVWLAAMAAPAGAQTVQVTYEHEFGAYRYRFENPSTFDTPQLVPHFFEQKYDTNNDWLVGRAAYGGPVVQLSIVTTRETTDSDVHEILVGAAGEASRGRWTLAWSVDGVPATFARLTVLLPDKYPDQPLRFLAARRSSLAPA